MICMSTCNPLPPICIGSFCKDGGVRNSVCLRNIDPSSRPSKLPRPQFILPRIDVLYVILLLVALTIVVVRQL